MRLESIDQETGSPTPGLMFRTKTAADGIWKPLESLNPASAQPLWRLRKPTENVARDNGSPDHQFERDKMFPSGTGWHAAREAWDQPVSFGSTREDVPSDTSPCERFKQRTRTTSKAQPMTLGVAMASGKARDWKCRSTICKVATNWQH